MGPRWMRAGAVALLVVGTVATMFVSVPVAGAGVIAPTGLAMVAAPSLPGSPASTVPILEWDAVAGAGSYRVEMSADVDFDPLLVDVVTAQHRLTPAIPLAWGEVHWRVRARAADGSESPPSAPDVFVLEPPGPPTLVAPADGATLAHPTDPLTFEWSEVADVAFYEVDIATDPTFASIVRKQQVSGTRLTLPDQIEADRDYAWRVAPVMPNAEPTAYSAARTFRTSWTQKPVLVTPAAEATVRDVDFRWRSVRGADAYDLEVSASPGFETLELSVSVTGPHYQPPTALGDGLHYWRVHAVDAFGHGGESSGVASFTRAWTDSPSLLAPADGQPAADPLTFRWAPVPLASRYQIQMSPDPGFPAATSTTCASVGTTFIPDDACGTGASYGGTTYWRVRGLDQPAQLTGTWSPTRSFVRRYGEWDPSAPGGPSIVPVDGVHLLTPADGASTEQPTFGWTRNLVGIGSFHLRVLDRDGEAVVDVETVTSHYTPSTVLDPARGPYRWSVVPISFDGRQGPLPGMADWRSFDLRPAARDATLALRTPAPAADAVEMPDFTWQPYTGADRYVVRTSVPGSGVDDLLGESDAPGYTPTGAPFAAGTYEWFVDAYAGATFLHTSARQTFEVRRLTDDLVAGRVACPDCARHDEVTSTPTLQWDPVPEATTYRVRLSLDADFTDARTYLTSNPTFLPPDELADTGADATGGWYWHVQPCSTPLRCSADPVHGASVAHFTKRSEGLAAAQLTPDDGAPVEIPAPDDDPAPAPALAWPALIGGVAPARYEVQVAADDLFATRLDDRIVDQPFFTPFVSTYPFDVALHWRVRGIDGSGNALAWSEAKTFRRPGRIPAHLLPEANAVVVGMPTLSWEPVAGAFGYHVQLYKRADLDTDGQGNPILLPQNLVVDSPTPTNSFTPLALLEPGVYAWRVGALDDRWQQGPWTPAAPVGRRVTIVRPALTPLAPPDDAVVHDDDLLFAWASRSLALFYSVDISTTPTFSLLVTTAYTSTNAWALPGGLAPSINPYYWRVTAYDTFGHSLGTSAPRRLSRHAFPVGGCGDTPFVDVAPAAPFCAEVAWLYDTGITTGSTLPTGDVVFRPGTEVSRLALASFLWRTAGKPAVSGAPFFADVAPDDPTIPADKYAAIQWLGISGLAAGTPDPPNKPRFLPNAAVSRQAMAAFLHRFANRPPVDAHAPRFVDVPPAAPFFTEIQWMGQSGLSTGSPNPVPPNLPFFKPTDPVTRQAMAAFLSRFAHR